MARAPVNTNLGGGELPRPMASPRGINAPVASVPESGLMALAQSLSNIRPELNQYLEEAKTDYREQEAARAYDTIQGMTFDQAREAVQAGTMRDTESPWFRAAFQKQFGMAHAANRRREIITAYNTEFDKQGGNLDEFLARYAQEDYETYGSSGFISSGIREGMDGLFNSIRDQHAEFTSTQLQARAADQFYTVANQAVATAVESGGDVNAAITAVTSQHISAGLVDQDKADAALIGLAEQYANEGNIAALEAVLNADPYGRGSFASRGTFATKAQSLIEQGKAVAADTSRKALIEPRAALEDRAAAGLLSPTDRDQITAWVDNGVMTPDAAETLLRQHSAGESKRLVEAAEMNAKAGLMDWATAAIRAGKAGDVQDQTIQLPDGTTKKVTGTELRQQFVDEQMGALLDTEGSTVAGVAAHMSSWAVPETYKPWEMTLTNGFQSITSALVGRDGTGKVTLQQPAMDAYVLYREMAGSPQVRERHIKDATAAAVYRDAETLERVGGMSAEEALIAAASIDRNSSRSSLAARVDTDKFTDAIDGFLDTDNANDQIVKTAVEEHARILLDLGVSQDKAIEEAIRSFETSYTSIGGVYVNTRDRFVPSEMEAIAAAVTEDFLAANPNRDEAYLIPDRTQDYWTVADEFGRTYSNSPKIHVTQLSAYLSNRTRDAVNAEITGN